MESEIEAAKQAKSKGPWLSHECCDELIKLLGDEAEANTEANTEAGTEANTKAKTEAKKPEKKQRLSYGDIPFYNPDQTYDDRLNATLQGLGYVKTGNMFVATEETEETEKSAGALLYKI